MIPGFCMPEMETINNIDIPEWLLIEVLIRLPAKFVCRFKTVSKKWLSLILDPSFVRMYVSRASLFPQLQPCILITGYISLMSGNSLYFSNQKLLMDSHSGDPKCPSFYTLPFPDTEQPFEKCCRILGVSNGIVLYHPLMRSRKRTKECIICNPLTKQWIALPHFVGRFNKVCWGFLTQVEDGILRNYRVVRLDLPLTTFEVFFSEIGEWKNFNVSSELAIKQFSLYKIPTALNRILHWIASNRGIIAYDPYQNPNDMRVISVPDTRENNIIQYHITSMCGAYQGKLRYFEASSPYLCPNNFSSYSIWVLNDYNTGDWCLQHRVSNTDILLDAKLSGQSLILVPVSFHPFDSDIVYLGLNSYHKMHLGFNNIIVSYNTRTRKMEALDFTWADGRIYNESWLPFLLLIPPWPLSIINPLLEPLKND